MTNHIADAWISFVAACELVEAPAEQLREMRIAFFGGALTVFGIVVDLGTDAYTEDEGVHELENIKNELEKYNRELQAALLP